MTHAWNSYSGPAVITGSWTNAYKTKDLSSIVGSQTVVVFLEIQSTFGSTSGFAVRPNGDTDSYYDPAAPNGAKGACSAESLTGYSSGVFCLTDSSGVIEYRGENKNANAFLRGWFVPTSATKLDVFNGVMPIAWTSQALPAGPDVAKDTLLFFKYKTTANTDYLAIRPDGSSDDFLATATLNFGGVSMGGNAVVNDVTALIGSYSASNGPYEHISDNGAGGPATVDCDLLAYEQVNFISHNDLVFSSTDISGSWVEVDLSPYVGVAYALALLKVESINAATHLDLAARPNNSSQNWKLPLQGQAGGGCCMASCNQNECVMILVPTGPGGKIEVDFLQSGGGSTTKITLMGSISEEEVGPPVVSETYPLGNFVSVDNPEKISFVLSNLYGVVKNTICLKARDPIGKETQIICNGVFQGDFSGYIAEVGPLCMGHPSKIYVQVDEFEELLLPRKWTFIVDAENCLGVPI